jgi:hypothetical protein
MANFNGGVIIVGGSQTNASVADDDSLASTHFDMLFMLVDEFGQQTARTTFGVPSKDEIATSILRTESGFIVTGYSTQVGSDPRKEQDIADDLQGVTSDTTNMVIVWLDENLNITRSRNYSLTESVPSADNTLDTFQITVPNKIQNFGNNQYLVTGSAGLKNETNNNDRTRFSQLFYVTLNQDGNPLIVSNFGEDVRGSRFSRGSVVMANEYPVVLSSLQRDQNLRRFRTRLTILNPTLTIPLLDNELNGDLSLGNPFTTTENLRANGNTAYFFGSTYSDEVEGNFIDQNGLIGWVSLQENNFTVSDIQGGFLLNQPENTIYSDGTIINGMLYAVGTITDESGLDEIFVQKLNPFVRGSNLITEVDFGADGTSNPEVQFYGSGDSDDRPIKIINAGNDHLLILAETELGEVGVITLIKSKIF